MTIYTCDFKDCNRKFYRPHKLQNHYNLHDGKKPFKCTISGCDKSYSSSSHLHRHIKCSHNVQSQPKIVYVCSSEFCGATFETLWGLQRHENNHLSSLYCEKCKRSFRTSSSLNKHMEHHENVSKRKCQYCGEDFSSKQKRDLLRHEKTHHHIKCEFCGKNFQSVNLLQRHLVIHESRFECDHCGIVMKSKNSLRNHITSLHIGSVLPHVCEKTDCPKVYHYKRNCTKHLMQHDERSRFKCTIEDCTQQFLHKKSYQYHLKLHQTNSVNMDKKRTVVDRAKNLVNALCN